MNDTTSSNDIEEREARERQARKERKIDQGRKLIEALREAGYKPFSYGGRGMYGERCVAVDQGSDNYSTFDDSLDLFKLGRDLADVRDLDSPTTDSMGRGIVAYWRDTLWPPDAKDSRDDDEIDDDSDDDEE
jgi:hypothetical protein